VLPLALIALAAVAWAANPSYLNEMPSVDRVLAEVKGRDNLDTLARQCGALEQMGHIIEVMAGARRSGRPSFTADEARLKGKYDQTAWAMTVKQLNSFDPAETKRLGMKSPRALWYSKRTIYGLDPQYREELLKQFFSPAWQAEFRALIRDPRKDVLPLTPATPRQSPPLSGTNWGFWMFTTQQMYGVTMLFLLTLVLLYAAIVEFFPVGLHPSDRMVLRGAFRRYQLYTCTGVARGVSQYSSTTRWASTDQRGVTTYGFSTTYYNTFFIQPPNAPEHSVTLVNEPNAPTLRDGHVVSAVWAIRRWRKFGDYLFFYVHSTNQVFVMKSTVARLIGPRRWPTLPILAYFWYGNYLWPAVRELFWTFTAVLLITYWIVRWLLRKWRVRRFTKNDVPVLMKILSEQAQGIRGW
jgi:hypothetical protein